MLQRLSLKTLDALLVIDQPAVDRLPDALNAFPDEPYILAYVFDEDARFPMLLFRVLDRVRMKPLRVLVRLHMELLRVLDRIRMKPLSVLDRMRMEPLSVLDRMRMEPLSVLDRTRMELLRVLDRTRMEPLSVLVRLHMELLRVLDRTRMEPLSVLARLGDLPRKILAYGLHVSPETADLLPQSSNLLSSATDIPPDTADLSLQAIAHGVQICLQLGVHLLRSLHLL